MPRVLFLGAKRFLTSARLQLIWKISWTISPFLNIYFQKASSLTDNLLCHHSRILNLTP